MMRKIICLLTVLFFIIAINSPAAFCAEKKDLAAMPTSGASIAGSAMGTVASAGIATGTIVIGVALLAALTAGVIIAVNNGRKDESPAPSHH